MIELESDSVIADLLGKIKVIINQSEQIQIPDSRAISSMDWGRKESTAGPVADPDLEVREGPALQKTVLPFRGFWRFSRFSQSPSNGLATSGLPSPHSVA